MKKFELKIIDNKLVIDLNKMTDDYMESYGYDGLPNRFYIPIKLFSHQNR